MPKLSQLEVSTTTGNTCQEADCSKEIISSLDEEHVEQTEQTLESAAKDSSVTLRVKETSPINPYKPPIPFSRG